MSNSTGPQHVVIAGGGIIGLSCALEFASSGFRVTVFEQGRSMEGSSWAAAGMLAVHDPENAPELLPLAQWSRSLYPEFLQRIERLSGVHVPLRTQHTLQGTHSGGYGDDTSLLEGLVPGEWHFHHLEEASLDPRDLCAALPEAARAAGVNLREGSGLRQVAATDEGLEIVASDGSTIQADHFVLAAGAWSSQIQWAGLDVPALPLEPRKGQMIEVQMHGDAPELPLVIRTPELYLVPRGDRRVVIGATVEHAGFDREIDEEAGDRLWRKATALWPPIEQGSVRARWTGLRPGFARGFGEGLPLIGPLAQNKQSGGAAWIAAGHFRNGILLAPGTGRLLRQAVEGTGTEVSLEPFSVARLGATSVALPTS